MDKRLLAFLIPEAEGCQPDLDPQMLARLQTPQAKSILSTIRSEAEGSQDKDNALRRLVVNGVDMVQIVAAIHNTQCINIPGSREDVGSTYLEQQIGGIITRLWPTDIVAANFAREIMGMKPQKEKPKEKQAEIAARQAMRRRKKIAKMRKDAEREASN